MTADTGGPAFPSTHMHGLEEGMTLRDYFAAKAMQSHIVIGLESLCKTPGVDTKEVNEAIAAWSYQMADAMLKARDA